MSVVDAVAIDDLVERARRHDPSAFTSLVAPRLAGWLRTATAILGNDPDARDALQAALTSAWSNLAALRDPNQFEAWLTRILVNECRHTLRRRARSNVRELHIDERMLDRHRSSGETPDPAASVAERSALERAFERLSGEARTLLVLHHLERRPVDAIAVVLRIPPGTVKSRLHAARRALERELEQESR